MRGRQGRGDERTAVAKDAPGHEHHPPAVRRAAQVAAAACGHGLRAARSRPATLRSSPLRLRKPGPAGPSRRSRHRGRAFDKLVVAGRARRSGPPRATTTSSASAMVESRWRSRRWWRPSMTSAQRLLDAALRGGVHACVASSRIRMRGSATTHGDCHALALSARKVQATLAHPCRIRRAAPPRAGQAARRAPREHRRPLASGRA